MFGSIEPFKVKLWLWENQFIVHKIFHFLHLKSLETVFPEHIQEFCRNIFLLQEKHGEHSSKVIKM